MSGADAPGRREVAHRLFAAEFDDSTLSYSESDEERAPNYVVSPTGARINRLFVAGVLTEVERINNDTLRGRVVDPTGAFVTYAGQYQPGEQTFLDTTSPPAFVALTGKARTFEPDDSDVVYTSVRPESLNEIDAATRDRAIVTAARSTLHRLAVFELALASDLRGDELAVALEAGGAPASLAAGIPRAIDQYGTGPAYLEAVRTLAIDALEVVTGDREEVRSLDTEPDDSTPTTVGQLPDVDVSISEVESVATDSPTASEIGSESVATSSSIDEPSIDESSIEEGDPMGERTPPTEQGHTTDSTATGEEEPSDSEETPVVGEEEPSDSEETPVVGEEELSDSEETPVVGEEGPSGSEETPAAGEEMPTAGKASAEGDGSSDETSIEGGTDDAASVSEQAVEGMYELDDEERAEIESEFGTDFSTGTEVDDPGQAGIDVPDADELAEQMAATESGISEADDSTDSDASGDSASTRSERLGDFPDETSSQSTGDRSASADLSGSRDRSASADQTESPPSSDPSPSQEPVDPQSAPADAAASAATDEPDVDVDVEDAAIDVMTELDDGDGADRETVVETIVDRHGVDPAAVEEAIQDALLGGRCYEPSDGVLKAI
ncbi:MAG: hypothetical protein ACQETB_10560 [Halobacteriota archaeon]